ncbi:hypothetical protein [Thermococcus sp. JdF3]|uniref:hypothetical protein n=1 Tax=Thermococcus sp. JdF3 TaxID=1638258 RepID=UPI00143BA166|nr:hypothetical protein [Thermococcus sp. JdF3]NJE01632.1 hypothetical protein [Thermococcus sp. JdF3]
MLVEVTITAAVAVVLAYYVKDVTSKVLARHFELKEELGELESKFSKLKEELESEIREVRTNVSSGEEDVRGEFIQKLNELQKKLRGVEKGLRDLQKLETRVDYEIGSLKRELDRTGRRVEELEDAVMATKDELKEELKREILAELEEEIEHLEDVIERRKQSEVEEFLEIITAAVTLQPEKLKDGMAEAKRALLSMRDIAKVYVLTGQGQREFRGLKENLIELLKNLRKLAVVSVPDESVYSTFNEIVVRVKRLDLPMRVVRDGKEKELNPEKSFIYIHRAVYELAGELDRIAEGLQEPIPVTPVEKEFYEKLRHQFEELQKLEEQVQRLMLKLGAEKEETEDTKDRDVEDLLKELNLL